MKKVLCILAICANSVLSFPPIREVCSGDYYTIVKNPNPEGSPVGETIVYQFSPEYKIKVNEYLKVENERKIAIWDRSSKVRYSGLVLTAMGVSVMGCGFLLSKGSLEKILQIQEVEKVSMKSSGKTLGLGGGVISLFGIFDLIKQYRAYTLAPKVIKNAEEQSKRLLQDMATMAQDSQHVAVVKRYPGLKLSVN